MKKFLLILVVGLVAFIAIAMVQEWQVFGPWLGLSTARPAPSLAGADRQAAEQTVRELLTMVRHYYLSAGDERFADRMPAGPVVTAELKAEVEYLKSNGRVQEATLQEFEVVSTEQAGRPDQIELVARESWTFATHALDDNRLLEPPQPRVVIATYRLKKQQDRWRVVGWSFTPTEPPQAAGN